MKVWVWDENESLRASFVRTIAIAGYEVNGCSGLDVVIPLCRAGQLDIVLIDTTLRGPSWALETVDILRRYAVRVGNALHPHILFLIADTPNAPVWSAAFRMNIPLVKKDDWKSIAHWLAVLEGVIEEDQRDEMLFSIFHT